MTSSLVLKLLFRSMMDCTRSGFSSEENGNATGLVKFSINDPSSGKSISSISRPISDLPEKGYFSFEFPEIANSNQKMYFASLSYEGQDSVSLGAADGTQYINGSAYRNQMPIDAQLAFQLGHEIWTLISGLGKELAGWLWNILVGLLLFVVPGWGIMSWLLPGWYKNDGLERLLFSFALHPLFSYHFLVGEIRPHIPGPLVADHLSAYWVWTDSVD